MTELELKIKHYADAYYNGIAEIDDDAFDALVDQLREENPDSEILKTVGWGSDSYGEKVEHKYQRIGSLNKVKEIKYIPPYQFSVASAKLDGLSAVLYYKNGRLLKAVTRGNGDIGINISSKISKISRGCEVLKDAFTGSIRGELVIPNANWEIIKAEMSEYKNPRNAVSGLINRKESSDLLKYVNFVTYNILGYEDLEGEINQGSVYRFLSDNGFKVCPHEYENDPRPLTEDHLKKLYDSYCEIYPCDGLVIGDMNLTKNENNAIVYNQIAFKFQAECKETIVEDIIWSVTRTGKVVPVIRVKPVELSGATVRRCTAYNAKYILENKINIGSKILIQRSNEVIPKIIYVYP